MAQLEWLTHVWVEKQVWNSLVIRMSETTTFLLCMCRLFVRNCHESWYHVGWYVLEMYKVCSCTKPSFAFFLDGPANVSAKLPLHVHSCSRRQARCGVTFLSSTLSGLLLQRAYTYSKGSQGLSLTSDNFYELHITSFLDKMWHDIEWHRVFQSGLFLGQHGSSLAKGLDTREPGLEQVWNERRGWDPKWPSYRQEHATS